MNIISNDNTITLNEVENFNIKQTLECGQAFRFELINDRYKIIAKNKILYVKENTFYTTKKDFEEIWLDYFDLKKDYSLIQNKLCEDSIMKKAIEYGKGIRILNQDKFEMLISFIISQNNRIPMIKKVINNISEKYGTDLGDGYAFPTVEQLSKANINELMECKTGFRAKYIMDALEKVNTLDLNKLDQLPTPELKEKLKEINGVGDKVANCISLFGYGRCDSFPIDVWIKRIMEHFYYNSQDTNKNIITADAIKMFGQYCGYAQQYLFYYAREEKIGK
ncbi:MAG: DNA-3-methyladenine glycosylase family protein [Lachnospirales bacterium]